MFVFKRNYVVKVSLMLMVLLVSPSLKAGYAMAWNDNLNLCKDFLSLVNSRPVGYYDEGKPYEFLSEEFENVDLRSVDKVEYFKQLELEHLNHIGSGNVAKDNSDERFARFKETYFSSLTEVFRVGKVDANHNGVLEEYFVMKMPVGDAGIYYFYKEMVNEKLLEKGERISFSGHPFIYRGRFYIAKFNRGVGVTVSEPSLPWGKDVGISLNQEICSYGLPGYY